MSTAELLEQVKALPRSERDQFLTSLLSFEEEAASLSGQEKNVVRWPDVEARAKEIFGDRISPNLILQERDESR